MTTQATHTPGPWEISKNEAGELDICEAGAGNMLADLAKCKNAEANARLIAAAPEMLEIARWSCAWANGWRPSKAQKRQHYENCLAAIAKAEGRAGE
jgi:hypothetical protein